MAYIEREMQNHTIEFNVYNKPHKFDIWVNADERTVESAVISWANRTDEYTAQSLCNYINSKGVHNAIPAQ